MTQLILSQATQNLINAAIASGPGYQNDNYVEAYNAIYADLVANGGINAATVAWFQQASAVDQQQWVPTAQGTFIWAYTEAASASEGAIITPSELQAASNQIALTVFQTLQSNDFVFDDSSTLNGFSPQNIVADDAGAGIRILQLDAPGANLDYAIWGGSLFARTELQDASYFSDYSITVQPNTRDSSAILAGLAAGSAAVLTSFSASIISTGFTKGLGKLDFDAISSMLSDQQKTIVTWSVIAGGTILLNPSTLADAATAYILDSTQNAIIQFLPNSSSSQATDSGINPQSASSTVEPIEIVDPDVPASDLDLDLDSNGDGSAQLLASNSAANGQSIIDFAAGGLTGDTIGISQSSTGTVEITTDIGTDDTVIVASDSSLSGVSQDFSFNGIGETLQIDNASGFAGTISSFVSGNTIDLAGVAGVIGAALSTGDVLTVEETGGGTIALNLDPTQDYSGDSFLIAPDASGGIDIIAEADNRNIAFTGTSEVVLVADATNLTGTISDPGLGDIVDFEYPNGTSQIETFGSDGISGTASYTGPEGTGTITQIIMAGATIYATEGDGPLSQGITPLSDVVALPDGSLETSVASTEDPSLPSPSSITGLNFIEDADGSLSIQAVTADGTIPAVTYAPGLASGNTFQDFVVGQGLVGYLFGNAPDSSFETDIILPGAVTFAGNSGIGSDFVDFIFQGSGGELGIAQDSGTEFSSVQGIWNFQAGDTVVVDLEGFPTFGSLEPRLSADSSGIYLSASANGSPYIETLATIEPYLGYSPSSFTVTRAGGGFYDITTSDVALCFLIGTAIATPRGEVPVECLAVGDDVLTLRGEARRITWIGIGRVLATRGRRNAATPVIVRKGALAGNVPHRDLRVTKGHSFYIDDALIPVEFLVNHRSILWDDHAQEVRLYHIELETHDVLIANGAPAESYRDDGNRWLFQNANSGWNLPPQGPCAPVLTGGPLVDAVWRRLLDRTGPRKQLPLTDDPNLYLLVDDRRVDAEHTHGLVHVFPLPDAPKSVRIISRTGVPAELGLARDPRCLGVALRQLVLRQGSRFLTVDAAADDLMDGFHTYEDDNRYRWTDGNAALPAALLTGLTGPSELVLHLGDTTHYLDDGCACQAA